MTGRVYRINQRIASYSRLKYRWDVGLGILPSSKVDYHSESSASCAGKVNRPITEIRGY